MSKAYTPGVGRVCMAIHEDPDAVWALTGKGHTVAVVTDGSAVLGLGDIGAAAALPVMEGKALLFKEFGRVDAWPICLDTNDPDEIVAIVTAIAPGFGGINPRGHQRASLFPDRRSAQRASGHSDFPRRSARDCGCSSRRTYQCVEIS